MSCLLIRSWGFKITREKRDGPRKISGSDQENKWPLGRG